MAGIQKRGIALLKQFYTEKVTIYTKRTAGRWANTAGTERIIKGAIQSKIKNIISPNGQQVTSNSILFTQEALSISDQIVYNSKKWTILQISPIINHFDNGKLSHYEVYF